jgi:putative MATE family efflux protein
MVKHRKTCYHTQYRKEADNGVSPECMKTGKYEMDLCSGSIIRKVISFSIPLMLTGVLQLLYNAADVIVVGQFSGKEALAAVGSTSSLINLLVNVFLGLSVGTSVAVAQSYGAGDTAAVQRTVHTSVALALVSGVGIGTVGFVFARPLLGWMGNPPDVIDSATLYIRIYFLGMPVNMLYTFGAAVLRAVGDTKRPLAFLTVAGVINVLLNLVFVIALRMSVAGVALATIIAQAVSAALVIRCLMHSDGSVHFSPADMRFHRDSLARIIKVGLPAGLQSTMFSISNVLIQSSINTFGSVVMAGNAAAGSLEGFVYTSQNSIYQACLTFTSQNHGAKQYRRVRKVFWVCLVTVLAVGFALGGLFVLLASQLVGIYNPNPLVIAEGVKRLSIICGTYFVCGVMEVLVGQLRGLGYSIVPAVATLVLVCVLRIVWIYTVFRISPTIETLMWSYPLSWLLAALFHAGTYLTVQRRLPRDDTPLPPDSCNAMRCARM